MAGILKSAGLDKPTWDAEDDKVFFALMQEKKRCPACGCFLKHEPESSQRLPRDGSDDDVPFIHWIDTKRCSHCGTAVECYI